MAIETWKFVQEKSKQAMKQVLGIKNEALPTNLSFSKLNFLFMKMAAAAAAPSTK